MVTLLYLDREWKRTRGFGNIYIQKPNRNQKRTKYRKMLGPTFQKRSYAEYKHF